MATAKRCAPSIASNSFDVRPKSFIFFDRTTEAKTFEVKATAEGYLPVDLAASQLAMQCLARGRQPRDFQVAITADADLLSEIVPRARRLAQECLPRETTVRISRRQEEVLRAIAENMSNKEIAARFHITERTAKFHVSRLLVKFRVQNRASLMLLVRDSFAYSDKSSVVRVGRKPSTESNAPGALGANGRLRVVS